MNSEFNEKNYSTSAYYFDRFTKNHPNSSKKEEAAFLSAYSYKLASPLYSLDQLDTNKALVAFQMFIDEYPDSEFPVVEDGKYKGMIGVGGLVLARVPEEIAQQRNEYYAKQHSDKVEAMDNDLMKEQHPSMPIDIDRQSRVTFGGSKKS